MRVVAQQWTSLDSYASGPSGEDEIFASAPREAHAASERWNIELLDRVDHVLLGRRTYELFVGYWPEATEPLAARINAIPKVVCSRSLEAAPWDGFAPARVAPDALAHLRSHRDGSGLVLIWGSLSIVHQLVEAGELDELDLFVAPVALGGGTPLLPPSTVGLSQLGVEDLGGAVHVRYAVASR